MKKLLLSVAILTLLSACDRDAAVVSRNLSTDADNFKVNRRVVFYNGITGDYMLSIEGRCSSDADTPRKVAITCQTGPTSYKKHILGLSDNVTYFIEQLDAADVSPYHYKVVFKPSVIIPELEIR